MANNKNKPKASSAPKKIGVKKPTKPTASSSTGHTNNEDFLAGYRRKQTTQKQLASRGKAKQVQTVSAKQRKGNGVVSTKQYKKKTRGSGGAIDNRYADQRTNEVEQASKKDGKPTCLGGACVKPKR